MKEEMRKEIRLDTFKEVESFVNAIVNDGTNDKYILQDQTGGRSADARTIIGIAYAASEFDKVFLVNLTHDGTFPSGL